MAVFTRTLSFTPEINSAVAAKTSTTAGTLTTPPSPGALTIASGSVTPAMESSKLLRY
jgi:hypothetical protein